MTLVQLDISCHEGTCDVIPKDEFQQWRNRSDLSSHNRVFGSRVAWTGNQHCEAYFRHSSKLKNHIVAHTSHARGDNLRNPLACYARCHTLLGKNLLFTTFVPKFHDKLQKIKRRMVSATSGWRSSSSQDMSISLVFALDESRSTLHVDGIIYLRGRKYWLHLSLREELLQSDVATPISCFMLCSLSWNLGTKRS